jgi:MYXO-CTERM domain-containing protein
VWSPWKTLGGVSVGVAMLVAGPSGAVAAELPAHDPLRILIISDEVNPHGLSDGELTQPGDMSAAIGDPGSGLELEVVEEVGSECLDDALTMLAGDGAHVVVYFAHLPATACDGSPRQEQLTTAMEEHLRDGGGVVVFHHGIYEAAGKEAILQLLGGRASSVAWDTAAGQDVIAVGGEHFVTSQGLQYSGMRSFEGMGVPAGDYPFFNNTPDERYDAMALLTAAGEERTILFVGADAGGGAARVLGYDLWRPGWMGRVVWYQPGEYQPNSMDVDGNNFQALANAIVYVATTQEDPGETTGADTGMPGEETGSVDGSGGTDGGAMTSMGVDDGGGSTSAGTGTGGGATDDGGKEGCGCRNSGGGAGALALALGLLGIAKRRRRRQA